MKNKKTLLLLLLTVSVAWGVTGQSLAVDSSVLRGYDAGVVSRVYAIAKYTHLSGSQQMYLASYFRLTDSIVKAWIFQGVPAARIDSLQERAGHIFYEMGQISAEQRREYGEKKAARFAEEAAGGEMDYIHREYQPGGAEEEVYRKWLTVKYSRVYQRYLEDGERTQYVTRDADLYQLYPALYAGKYIGEYIQRLDSIRKLPDTTSHQIRMAFLNAVRGDKYGDWSRMLLDITRSLLPDTGLFSRLYHATLARQAEAMSAGDKYNLIQVQHVSYSGFQGVYRLVLDKNYANALLQLTHGNFRPYLLDSLVEKSDRYYDSLIRAALYRDGSLSPGNQFAIALKYREALNIDAGLVDTLLYHAMYLSQKVDSLQRKDPFYYEDLSSYESRVLSSLLTDEQYNNLLVIKNRPNAYAQAARDWEEMVRRGMTRGLDKDQTIDAIGKFYVAQYNAWNRMAHDSRRQTANMRALDEVKPAVLGTLQAARWNGDAEKQDNSAKVAW